MASISVPVRGPAEAGVRIPRAGWRPKPEVCNRDGPASTSWGLLGACRREGPDSLASTPPVLVDGATDPCLCFVSLRAMGYAPEGNVWTGEWSILLRAILQDFLGVPKPGALSATDGTCIWARFDPMRRRAQKTGRIAPKALAKAPRAGRGLIALSVWRRAHLIEPCDTPKSNSSGHQDQQHR